MLSFLAIFNQHVRQQFLLSCTVPTHFPLNLVARVLNSTSYQLTWDPPPQDHHNGEIREYRVNITELETGRALFFSRQDTMLLVSGLHPHYSYNTVVAAVTVDVGPYSAAVGVRTHEDGKGSSNTITQTSVYCTITSTSQLRQVHHRMSP